MQTHSRQTGLTFISLLLVLMMVGFFALLVLRLGPLYLENYTIRSVLKGIKEEHGSGEWSAQEIRSTIEKRLYINEIRRFDKPEDRQDIKIRKEDDVVKVSIDYEVREHIAANVDALVSFSDSVELPAH